MAIGHGSIRSRTASLLLPASSARVPKADKNSASAILNEQATNGAEERKGSATSVGEPENYPSIGDVKVQERDAQSVPRTIPAWVHTVDEDDDSVHEATVEFLEAIPRAQVAQHNTTPFTKLKRKNPLRSDSPRGRLYDSQREWIPPLPRGHVSEFGSRWRAFAEASAYPRSAGEQGQIVTEEWLAQNGADYSRPWLADAEEGDPEKSHADAYRFRVKRRAWYLRLQRTLLRNPIIPMIIRLNVFACSTVALALAVSIHIRLNPTPSDDPSNQNLKDDPSNQIPGNDTSNQKPMNNKSSSNTSTTMAIIVDAVALVYLLYITWDEYFGKPLGLRSPRAKMRLIFLDLFFIVFDSSNLSLAFEASKNESASICKRQKALASVLLIALIAWLLTFSISVMRVVEKVTRR